MGRCCRRAYCAVNTNNHNELGDNYAPPDIIVLPSNRLQPPGSSSETAKEDLKRPSVGVGLPGARACGMQAHLGTLQTTGPTSGFSAVVDLLPF